MTRRAVAVVGAGWAGLAAAVRAAERGHAVTVFEMAAAPGGRARSQDVRAARLDNGQHILIGAYERTQALMRSVGADPDVLLLRRPFALHYADGAALVARPGAPVPSFVGAVWRFAAWRASEKAALLAACARWFAGGFRCDASLSVADLAARLPVAVRRRLVEPLCVAALNTPAHEASAAVFLRVLRDALFGARGCSDLLLPRAPLDELLPQPALGWLRRAGARVELRRRVAAVDPAGNRWRVDGEPFDAVVLACTANEAARLARPHAPSWSARAEALRYEPIATVYTSEAGATLPAPMLALAEGPQAPAQFVFDLGRLGGPAGRFAFVVSGAAPWLADGTAPLTQAVLRQAAAQLPRWSGRAEVVATLAERRATFRCVPRLDRPPARIADGLLAAGDYVAGPYPSTLEGAVRAGEAAAAVA